MKQAVGAVSEKILRNGRSNRMDINANWVLAVSRDGRSGEETQFGSLGKLLGV